MGLSLEARTALRRIRADVLDGHWMQGDYHSEDGSHHCLVGFIYLQPDHIQDEVKTALAKMINPASPVHRQTLVVGWNDRKGRTKEEVVALIDRTLKGPS